MDSFTFCVFVDFSLWGIPLLHRNFYSQDHQGLLWVFHDHIRSWSKFRPVSQCNVQIEVYKMVGRLLWSLVFVIFSHVGMDKQNKKKNYKSTHTCIMYSLKNLWSSEQTPTYWRLAGAWPLWGPHIRWPACFALQWGGNSGWSFVCDSRLLDEMTDVPLQTNGDPAKSGECHLGSNCVLVENHREAGFAQAAPQYTNICLSNALWEIQHIYSYQGSVPMLKNYI